MYFFSENEKKEKPVVEYVNSYGGSYYLTTSATLKGKGVRMSGDGRSRMALFNALKDPAVEYAVCKDGLTQLLAALPGTPDFQKVSALLDRLYSSGNKIEDYKDFVAIHLHPFLEQEFLT